MFVTRLERIDGEYLVRLPRDVVVNRDLHEGQLVSVVIEPLDDYVSADPANDNVAEASWKLNEEATPPYDARAETRRDSRDDH